MIDIIRTDRYSSAGDNKHFNKFKITVIIIF